MVMSTEQQVAIDVDNAYALGAIAEERGRLLEQRQLLQSDRNLSRKRLRRDALRSSLNVWDAPTEP